MNAYIYIAFNEEVQQYLVENLPKEITPVFRTTLPKEQQEEAFRKAELVLGNPPPAWLQQAPSPLQFWQLSSAGFNQYEDLRLKIKVANMGDFFARPCAETIVGGVLAFYRGIHTLTKWQTQKHWQGEQLRTSLRLLGQQQVIVLGAGAIGKYIKQMLSGFGCTIRMAARTNPLAEIHSREDLLKMLKHTNLVINTLPGSAEKYVTAEVFEALPEGAVYASVGRGETTDEQALINVLRNGKLAGAVLDVTETEPLPADSPLWSMDNVILTQHTGGGKADEGLGIAIQFIANVNHFLKKEPLEDKVELSRGY
jgi:phosphoglycerate dehydrogenase-like enzyme